MVEVGGFVADAQGTCLDQCNCLDLEEEFRSSSSTYSTRGRTSLVDPEQLLPRTLPPSTAATTAIPLLVSSSLL